MYTTFILCGCDMHYGGDALQCSRDRGGVTSCGCDCHKVKDTILTIWGEFEIGGES